MLSSWGTWHLRLSPPRIWGPFLPIFPLSALYQQRYGWLCEHVVLFWEKTLTSHAGTFFFFFHCILKDEILARCIDLDCWSNSYYALPHINPQWVNDDCTKIYWINNPKHWQQDHMCFIGQKLSSSTYYSGSTDLVFLIPVCTLEPAFRSVSTTPMWQ